MVEREDAQISAAMALSVSAVLRVIVNRLELSGHGASSSSCPAVHSSNSLPEGLNRSGNPSAPSSIMRSPEAMALSRTSFSARLIKGGIQAHRRWRRRRAIAARFPGVHRLSMRGAPSPGGGRNLSAEIYCRMRHTRGCLCTGGCNA